MSAASEALIPEPPRLRRFRLAAAWLVYFSSLVCVAHLYRARVTSSDAPSEEAKPIAAAATPETSKTSLPASEWAAKLAALTKSDAPPAEICRGLCELFPSLPEDGQLEALRQIVNLLPDADYGILRDLAETTPLPPSAWEILATDALTRPSSVNLPVLLEVLAHGPEPVRSEAKAELLAQLGGDYGDDWARWKEEIQRQRTKPE